MKSNLYQKLYQYSNFFKTYFKALGLGNKIGSLRPNKQFDALLIDTKSFPDFVIEDESVEQIFERWVRTGSKDDIVQIYVAGKERKNASIP